MKLIGISVGNSPYEVGVLKEAYNFSFPNMRGWKSQQFSVRSQTIEILRFAQNDN